MSDINVNIDATQLKTAFTRLVDRCQNRQPLMRNIAGIMHSGVQDNFSAGGRPRWLGVKRGGTPLTLSGNLKNSIHPFNTNDMAGVGTNVKYAAIHNFGGQTRPHVIRPKYKKALAFNGRVVKKVNHPGSKIPARKFMVLTPAEIGEIQRTVNRYLQNSI